MDDRRPVGFQVPYGGGRSALVLLGPSQAGKSTQAAALRARGWRVLSDDISLLDVDRSPVVAYAADTGLCLWPDSLTAVNGAAGAGRTVAGHVAKRRVGEDDDGPERTYPVAALVLLEPRMDVELSLDPVDPPAAAMCAGQQMVAFHPKDTDRVPRAWAAIGRLASAVPMFRCRYRRGFDRLAGVTDMLVRCVRDQPLART